jgi:hypothetical protein
MKKHVFFLLVIGVLFFCGNLYVFANNGTNTVPDYASMSANELAYCDIEIAPAEWQQKISDARYPIIYSESWAADGQEAAYVHPDGTVEKIPAFSDVFPGWEIPVILDENIRTSFLKAMEPYSSDPLRSGANYVGGVYLFTPSSTQSSVPFYLFDKGLKSTIVMQAYILPGSTYNGGFSNITTGQDLVYKTNMSVSGKVYLYNIVSGVIYGARASTYSTEGYAELGVHDDF